jgi:hypothetical protein
MTNTTKHIDSSIFPSAAELKVRLFKVGKRSAEECHGGGGEKVRLWVL